MEVNNIILTIIGGTIGAATNEFFRNQPVFGLKFYLGNKNLEAFDLKVGIEIKKGIAKNVKWSVQYTGNNNDFKNFFEFQKGEFKIIKEGESRYIFSIRSDDYKNFEFWEHVKIIIEYGFILCLKRKQELIFDLRELPFDDAIKNKELVDLSSYLVKNVKKNF